MAKYVDLIIRAKGDTKGVEDVSKSLDRLGKDAQQSGLSMGDALSASKGGLDNVLKLVAKIVPGFKSMGAAGGAALGAIGAAVSSVIGLVKSLYGLTKVAFNLGQVPDDVKAASAAMMDLNHEAKLFADGMKAAREESAKQSRLFEDQANALNRVVKAQNELKRAQELSLAVSQAEKDEINRRYNSTNAAADEEAAQSVRDSRRSALQDERARLEEELRAANGNIGKYAALMGKSAGATDKVIENQEIAAAKSAAIRETDAKLELLDQEEEAAMASIEARKVREETAAREAAEKKAEADRKAEEDAAKERERLDAEQRRADEQALKDIVAQRKAAERELHQIRVDNLRDELAKAQEAAAGKGGVISAAQTEFDRAFGMYRDKNLAASTVAEERSYAEDYRRLNRDASRYGGKWRIDELASLMAAGDTRGQQAKLEEWRKSSRFTPEVEAMVRASAADQTKTTAEAELRKISANTEGLAKKLDELLQVK